MRRSSPMFPLVLAGCAMALPSLAQHRPESPLPPSVATTHVPRLAAEPAPARTTKTKSVFGAAMALLIADLQAQQQAAPTADAPLDARDAATAQVAHTPHDALPDALPEHVALQDDDGG